MGRMPSVQIKGTRHGLVIMFNPARTFEELKESLLRQLEQARDFFQGARVTFSSGQGQADLPPEQRQELLRIVARYGLVYAEDITYPTTTKPTPAGSSFSSDSASPFKRREVLPVTPVLPEILPEAAAPALLINRSLRAGQTVKTANHLVITGNVHPGAQVSAGGSVVVLGHLSGTVAAGLYGDRSAVIAAGKLAPVALFIAGVSGSPPVKPLFAAKAALKGDKIIYISLCK